jgi:hypothetical protein
MFVKEVEESSRNRTCDGSTFLTKFEILSADRAPEDFPFPVSSS